MADLDELTVEIGEDGKGAIVTADTPAGATAPAAQPSAPAAPAAAQDDPAQTIEHMKRRVADAEMRASDAEVRARNESGARAAAETKATEAQRDAQQARVAATDRQYDSIVNALAGAETEMTALREAKAGAYESGDFRKAAELDVQMAKVGGRLAQLEAGKTEIEDLREQLKTAPPPPPPPPPAALTPQQQNDAYLADLARARPRSAEWIRAHPEFLSDRSFRSKVEAAASFAENIRGLSYNDPKYFEFIEEQVGLKSPTPQPQPQPTPMPDPYSGARAAAPRESAPTAPAVPAAAPSRGGTDALAQTQQTSGGRMRVTLTKEERELAHLWHPKKKPDDPDPEVVYARNKYELQREGRIGPGAR